MSVKRKKALPLTAKQVRKLREQALVQILAKPREWKRD